MRFDSRRRGDDSLLFFDRLYLEDPKEAPHLGLLQLGLPAERLVGNRLFDAFKDKHENRFFNCGVAEANMMNIGEAFAAMGYNAWVSTFCPFFDWKVLRRIAIGHQERLEAIKMKGGWLNEGHGLDLTFLATAPNFETRTNGATHMGNDDSVVFDAVAHVKIIDVSCPQQMLAMFTGGASGKGDSEALARSVDFVWIDMEHNALSMSDTLGHIILAHHGQYEFGSPKLPLFPEALLLHYLDDIEDLRIAVDEACAVVLPQARPESDLRCAFFLAPETLKVEVSMMKISPVVMCRSLITGLPR